MKRISAFFFFFLATSFASAQIDFGAYDTKVAGISAGTHLGKYADIIAIVGPGKQLEFTRATAYMPVWRTDPPEHIISAAL